MIEFMCRGCLNTHSANEAFAGMRARCVVCGAAIIIPGSSEAVAALAPSRSFRSVDGSTVARPIATSSRDSHAAESSTLEEEPESEDRTFDETGEESSLPKIKRLIAEPVEVDDPENDDESKDYKDPSEGDEVVEKSKSRIAREPKRKNAKELGSSEPVLDAIATVSEDPLSPEAIRKQRIKLASAIGATVFCVSMAIYVAFFRGDSTPKFEPPPTTPAPAKPPPPPPKKVEPPPLPVAPAPRPYRATHHFTSASFFLERSTDPLEFDKIYAGTYLIVQGTHARTANGTLTLANDLEDLEGIECVLSKPTIVKSAYLVDTPMPPLEPGRGVTIKGIYTTPLRLIESEVLAANSPADAEFKDKVIEIIGIVAQASSDEDVERNPTVILAAATTDCPISVSCEFPRPALEKIAKLRQGERMAIRGECEGRVFRNVRLRNCSLVGPDDPPDSACPRITSNQFFAAYEKDLLPSPRLSPNSSAISVSAEQLSNAFTANIKQANHSYRYHLLQISGRIVERRADMRTVLLETRANDRYKIAVTFTPAKFALLFNDKDVQIRGVCVGVRDSKFIRIENAELLNVEPRLVADYLPFQSGRNLLYESLTPNKLKDNLITQLRVHMGGTDLITTTAIRSGTYPGGTLLGDSLLQPKWLKDLTKQKTPPVPLTTQRRVKDDTIEIRAIPAPPLQPSPWWDPVLKLGCKKGDSWSSEMPDGRVITYTVQGFDIDEAQRPVVEIRRIAKHPKDMGIWEESSIVYARNLGEVRRSVTAMSVAGKGVTLMETRLVESGIEGVLEREIIKKELDKKESEKNIRQ